MGDVAALEPRVRNSRMRDIRIRFLVLTFRGKGVTPARRGLIWGCEGVNLTVAMVCAIGG